MANYFFILSYILVVSIVIYKKPLLYNYRSRKDNTFLFFSMGFLLLLNCLRGESVGNDTIAYRRLFYYYIGKGDLFDVSDAGLRWMNEYVDVGYRFINVLFGRISNNFQLFISLISVFLYYNATKFIKRESENVSISVLLFFLIFYHPYFNVLRQAIAVTILLIGFPFLKGKKYIKYSIFILVACLFHKTAVVAFLLIPLMHIRRYSFYRTLFIITAVIGLTATKLVSRIVSLLGYSGMYITEEQGLSTYAGILLSVIVFFLINYWRGNKIRNYVSGEIVNNESELDRFYSRIPVVQLCLSIASMNIPILYRCSYYFTFFYISGIPYFIMKSERTVNNKRITLFFIILVYVIYQVGILIFRPEWYTEFQYKFFWQ